MELHGYGYDRCFDCLFHPYNGQGRSRAIYKPWIYVFKGEQVKVKWKDMLWVDVSHHISPYGPWCFRSFSHTYMKA